ncbi:MAG: hypothetical protein KDA41_13595, partial [Planctomycetales bacterium]|nr:hypothetical protein [Planctomycetales bacterium]
MTFTRDANLRAALAAALLTTALLTTLAQAPLLGAEPQWIWTSAAARADAPAGAAYFRTAFTLNSVRAAQVEATCDNQFNLYVNGALALSGDNWQQTKSADISKHLKAGRNVIAVEATNSDGPAGLVARIVVKETGGVPVDASTSDKWKFSLKPEQGWRDAAFDDSAWASAHALGPIGKTAPWNGQAAPTFVATPATERPKLPPPRHPLEIRSGERVALLGGTFVERMQQSGELETLLTAAQPERNVAFRNL